MDDAQQTHEKVTQLACELADEILRRAPSTDQAFHLVNLAAVSIHVSVGLGNGAPEFRKRMVAEQNQLLVDLGIDPLQVYADRATGGD